MTDLPLTGVGVLVTRPDHQSGELIDAIVAAGGQPIDFPVIDIIPRDAGQIEADLADMTGPDIVIFVSANAVAHGVRWIPGDSSVIGAVGPATSRALQTAGVQVDICPDAGSDSEHLLAEDALSSVAGKTILIVRGASGREVLAATLRNRGAAVNYLPVYQSRTHAPPADALKSLEKTWRDGRVGAVMIMSVASLGSMLEILPSYCVKQLQKTRLVAPSTRVIQTAIERIPGVTGILSAGPGAGEMTGALIANLQGNSDTSNG
jgi:uroporphyrinogen-III synthase